MINRRTLIAIGILGVVGSAASNRLTFAKDGDHGSEGSGSGSSGSGSEGGSSSGEGSGEGSNSGSGSSSSNFSSGSKSSDDAPSSTSSGKGENKSTQKQSDQDKALEAAHTGEIMTLKDALKQVTSKVDGKVIDINLQQTPKRDIYQMKIRTPDGTIRDIKMDARTGKIAGLFGF